MKGLLGIVVLAVAAAANARTFTVTNNCPYTVWPAIFTDPNVGAATPDQPTGWEAVPGNTVSFSVPDNWAAGRIWGRRDCTFDSTGAGTCLSGNCNGGLLCDPTSGIGAPPASLAEFTLGPSAGNADWYDVSLVDGSNIPIQVNNDVGCPVASCPVDLNPNCTYSSKSLLRLRLNVSFTLGPAPLIGPTEPNGTVLGCKSACSAGLAPDPNNSPNCCTGSCGTPATCPPSGVQYYSYFKDSCPDSYAYAYDESSGTALWQCDGGLAADYTITFCPSASSDPPPPPPPPSNGYVQLHPNGNTAKCLDVQGDAVANGTPVQIYDCNGTGAQNWVLSTGTTSVQLSGTNYCLDIGSPPANGVQMEIWQCESGLAAQTWTYSSNTLANQGFCLDLTNGDTTDGNIVQIWQCVAGNANQMWTE
ncbi:hypothetical protein NM688_g1200 [Phlebia brevispora]|uniref:Uncharacterized protein n=1 Tax=Phlebia brevispora TaxID=194682 RepID=A0ACC1TCC5_9APHY|nr:hypothetical protein NM688_g1200 [Phlebia brevispora]